MQKGKIGRPRERFPRVARSLRLGRPAVNHRDAEGNVSITLQLREGGHTIRGNITKRITLQGRVSDVYRAIEHRLLKPAP